MDKKLTFKQLQQRIRQNKKNKKLPLDDPFVDLAWVNEELGELAMALRRKDKGGIIEECVDVMVLSLGIFEMYKRDCYEEVLKKIMINEKRQYKKLGQYNVRTKETDLSKEEIQIKTDQELTMKELQEKIWMNKQKQNFNLQNQEHDLICMFEEAAEAAWALRHKEEEKFIDAVADLVIYALGLLRMMKVDAYKALLTKIEINEGRANYQGEGKEFSRPDFEWK